MCSVATNHTTNIEIYNTFDVNVFKQMNAVVYYKFSNSTSVLYCKFIS